MSKIGKDVLNQKPKSTFEWLLGEMSQYRYAVWLDESAYLRNRLTVKDIDHLTEYGKQKGKVRILAKSEHDIKQILSLIKPGGKRRVKRRQSTLIEYGFPEAQRVLKLGEIERLKHRIKFLKKEIEEAEKKAQSSEETFGIKGYTRDRYLMEAQARKDMLQQTERKLLELQRPGGKKPDRVSPVDHFNVPRKIEAGTGYNLIQELKSAYQHAQEKIRNAIFDNEIMDTLIEMDSTISNIRHIYYPKLPMSKRIEIEETIKADTRMIENIAKAKMRKVGKGMLSV